MVSIRKLDASEEVDERDEKMRLMAAQLEGLTILVQRALASGDAVATISQADAEKKAAPLESVENERQRILAAWAAEDRVQIMIAPDEDDKAMRNDARGRLKQPDLDYLPRTFQVNGVQINIPVGRLTEVPRSIAAMYEYMLNPWAATRSAVPLTFEEAASYRGLT